MKWDAQISHYPGVALAVRALGSWMSYDEYVAWTLRHFLTWTDEAMERYQDRLGGIDGRYDAVMRRRSTR